VGRRLPAGPAAGQPRIVDFSFSELAATQRQQDLDVAELLTSLAILAGEDRAAATAVAGLGGHEVARSLPLLQPLALSGATRHAVAGQNGLLTRTRAAAAAASGQEAPELVRVQRVRPGCPCRPAGSPGGCCSGWTTSSG